MKLHDASTRDYNTFTGYENDCIAVNGVVYRSSLIVTPDHINDAWSASTGRPLTAEDLLALATYTDSIVLLGTGQKQAFPAPALLRPLYQKQIAVEIMDNFAACRTYNILAAEGRKVVAALIVGAYNRD